MEENKTILHIDFDSFFASVEQQLNPRLRDKPMGVTAAHGRTCIIASSREAKKLGIGTGTRSWEAKKIYRGIILVPADFIKYWEVSKAFLQICSDYSPFVELFSLDEVFMDITQTKHLFGGSYGVIDKIKTRIRAQIGEYVTVSAGISHNKLLAKMASGLQKPNGIFEIKAKDVDTVYGKAELTDVCGIGERIAARLGRMGITSLLELRDTPVNVLQKEFGPAYSQVLKNIAWGNDDSEVIPYSSPSQVKSVSRNYCLPRNEYNKTAVMKNIYELCEEVALKLRRLNKKARTLGVLLHGSFNIHGRKTYPDYFSRGQEIFERIRFIAESAGYAGGKSAYVRQISVWAGNLESSENIPLGLFEEENKKEKLACAVDEINERFGAYTVRNGFLIGADKLPTMPNGYMADRWERKQLTLTRDK